MRNKWFKVIVYNYHLDISSIINHYFDYDYDFDYDFDYEGHNIMIVKDILN